MESAAAVPLTMTVSAWPSPVPLPGVPARSRFTSVTPVPDRSLTVMVSAPPRAATLTCSTPLTSMVDVADVAEQPQPAAVGRQVDVLVDVGAVELQRVGAALALDHVAAVAGVPHERVVAGAQEGHVVAAAADDGVVAVAADQHVVAVAAGDGVVARAAVHGQPDHAGGQSGGGDRVVAAERVHDELVVGPFGALDRNSGRQPGHGEAGPAAGDLDRVCVGGAVDDDGVGLAVAGAAAGRAREVEVDVGDVGAGQVVDGDGVGAAEGDDVDLLDAVDVHGRRCRRRGTAAAGCRWPTGRSSR